MNSPTSRSLKEMRSRGYIGEVVERWNSFAKIRHDFLNFADILYIKDSEPGVTALQVTTMDNISHRKDKILKNDKAQFWLRCGNRIAIWGWAKRGDRGKRKLWELKEQPIEIGHFS